MKLSLFFQEVKWCPEADSNHRHADFQSNRLHSENSALDRKKYQDKPGTPREPDTPALPSNAAAAKENPGALAGATEVKVENFWEWFDSNVKRQAGASRIIEAVLSCDPEDRVLFLDQGVIAAEGSADEIIRNPSNERLVSFVSRFNH